MVSGLTCSVRAPASGSPPPCWRYPNKQRFCARRRRFGILSNENSRHKTFPRRQDPTLGCPRFAFFSATARRSLQAGGQQRLTLPGTLIPADRTGSNVDQGSCRRAQRGRAVQLLSPRPSHRVTAPCSACYSGLSSRVAFRIGERWINIAAAGAQPPAGCFLRLSLCIFGGEASSASVYVPEPRLRGPDPRRAVRS